MTSHDECDAGDTLYSGYAAPVLDLCLDIEQLYPNGDRLPGLWITKPVTSEDGVPLVRVRTTKYDPRYGDPDGEEALWHGGGYYTEGMGYIDPADHDKRVDCFRAAELLYRHAAGKGNAVACLCLGYVYSYDRCEGQYWTGSCSTPDSPDAAHPFPREEWAFASLAAAARAGIAEACYKLGDMYRDGVGCAPDAHAAFRWYVRASELAAHEPPVILGSVALRLAGCYEDGLGCTQDFARALKWYRRAVDALDAAVEAGETWYEKAFAHARAGAKRCAQE